MPRPARCSGRGRPRTSAWRAGHAHPPLIAGGRVFLGFTGSDHSARGKVDAYDAESGERLWRTYTVPSPGDPAYDTWSADQTGVPPLGGATWHTFSYDPELGLIYAGTGQPTPRNRVLRGEGDALYTASILALDFNTGEIRWHFQVLPDESWDYDQPHESMLIDMIVDGEPRKTLVHTSKIGWGLVLDRETGEYLYTFRTGYDNVVTGWTPEGRPIYNPEVVPQPEDQDSGRTFLACPHLHGTRDLHSPSYSPVTGLYYIGINNSCQILTYFHQDFTGVGRYQGMNSRPAMAPGYDYVGEFVAFDPVTGERPGSTGPRAALPCRHPPLRRRAVSCSEGHPTAGSSRSTRTPANASGTSASTATSPALRSPTPWAASSTWRLAPAGGSPRR